MTIDNRKLGFHYQCLNTMVPLSCSLTHNQKFLNSSKEEVTVLEEMLKKMSNLFHNLLEYFVLDPKKNSSEEFFGNIWVFMQEYDVSNFCLFRSSNIFPFFNRF